MRANFLFLFILITTRLFSQDLSTNFVQEKDLTQYFYYYDLLDHTMLPYVETDEKKILYLTLKKEECVNKSITFESFKGLRFFVNGSFVEEYEAANEVVLLIAATDFNSSGVLVLSLIHI